MKKHITLMIMLAALTITNSALATDEKPKIPTAISDPGSSVSADISSPRTVHHMRGRLTPNFAPATQIPTPPITAAADTPPLECTIIPIGGEQPDTKAMIDLSAFTKPVSTPESQISILFERLNSTWDGYAHTIYEVQPSLIDMGTVPVADPISAPATRYFKSVFGRFQKDKQAWRRSVVQKTEFKRLQIDISNIMNTLTAEPICSEPPSTTRRLFRSKSTRDLGTVGDIIHRPLSPMERLRTFIGLINRLNAAGRHIFAPKTIRELNEKFGRSELIVTRVEALLVTNGSEIPAFTDHTLQPGDLGIIIETLSGPNNDIRTRCLLRIR